MAEEFLRLAAADRKDALAVAAQASGRAPHILEKDVMVVWALGAVASAAFGPDIIFKGGTSLSKIYRTIQRFSEDLDLTYDVRAFAKDLVDHDGKPLATTPSQVRRWTEKIRNHLEKWTQDVALAHIRDKAAADGLNAMIEATKDTILIAYEPLLAGTGYLAPTIRLEFGARSTGEPNEFHEVVSDAASHLPGVDFPIARCRVMRVERTFWEKATAVHVYCLQRKLRQPRFSRHWSDLAQLADGEHAARAIDAREIAEAVGSDKSILYREKAGTGEEIDYMTAVRGSLCLVPDGAALDDLADDYEQMVADGYFPEAPRSFDAVMEACAEIQAQANAAWAAKRVVSSPTL